MLKAAASETRVAPRTFITRFAAYIHATRHGAFSTDAIGAGVAAMQVGEDRRIANRALGGQSDARTLKFVNQRQAAFIIPLMEVLVVADQVGTVTRWLTGRGHTFIPRGVPAR